MSCVYLPDANIYYPRHAHVNICIERLLRFRVPLHKEKISLIGGFVKTRIRTKFLDSLNEFEHYIDKHYIEYLESSFGSACM